MNITQAFLPVRLANGSIPGVFAIAPTAFDGTETTFALAQGNVAVAPVIIGESTLRRRLPEYMAAVFTHEEEVNKAYATYTSSYVPLAEVMPSRVWQNAQGTGARTVEFNGLLVDALIQGREVVFNLTQPADPPTAVDAELSWVANTQFANVTGTAFFNVQWVELFTAAFPNREPAFLTVKTQPSEGDVKAFVVADSQLVAGTVPNNTIRIVKVDPNPIAAGTRDFVFTIHDRLGNAVDVELELTVS